MQACHYTARYYIAANIKNVGLCNKIKTTTILLLLLIIMMMIILIFMIIIKTNSPVTDLSIVCMCILYFLWNRYFQIWNFFSPGMRRWYKVYCFNLYYQCSMNNYARNEYKWIYFILCPINRVLNIHRKCTYQLATPQISFRKQFIFFAIFIYGLHVKWNMRNYLGDYNFKENDEKSHGAT